MLSARATPTTSAFLVVPREPLFLRQPSTGSQTYLFARCALNATGHSTENEHMHLHICTHTMQPAHRMNSGNMLHERVTSLCTLQQQLMFLLYQDHPASACPSNGNTRRDTRIDKCTANATCCTSGSSWNLEPIHVDICRRTALKVCQQCETLTCCGLQWDSLQTRSAHTKHARSLECSQETMPIHWMQQPVCNAGSIISRRLPTRADCCATQRSCL